MSEDAKERETLFRFADDAENNILLSSEQRNSLKPGVRRSRYSIDAGQIRFSGF